MRKFIQRPGTFRSAIAAVVALCVMVAGWMSVSPDLHEHLHHDSDHGDHSCLVTMMSAGGCDSSVVVPQLPQPPSQIETLVVLMHSEWVQPLFLDGGVLEHGPPARA